MSYNSLQYEIFRLYEKARLNPPNNLLIVAETIFDEIDKIFPRLNLKCDNFQYLLDLEKQEENEVNDIKDIDERLNEHNRYYHLLSSILFILRYQYIKNLL